MGFPIALLTHASLPHLTNKGMGIRPVQSPGGSVPEAPPRKS